MRTLRGVRALAAPGEATPYFSLSLISRREKRPAAPGLQGDAQFRIFPFDKRASLSETLALRESLTRGRRGGDERSESESECDARLGIDTLRWERLIEIVAAIARAVAEKTNPLGITRFPLLHAGYLYERVWGKQNSLELSVFFFLFYKNLFILLFVDRIILFPVSLFEFLFVFFWQMNNYYEE